MAQEITKTRKTVVFNFKEGFSDTIEERIRTRRFRLRVKSLGQLSKPIKILFFLFLIAGLSYLAVVQMNYLFFGTSYFEIRAIEVEGLKNISRENLLKFANVAPGCNILTLDRQALQERILQHPWIKECHIDLSGLFTLHITVTERTPFLYIKTESTFLEVAEDGMILEETNLCDRDLTIITGLKTDNRQVGDSFADHDGFIEARTWVSKLPSDILSKISEINFTNLYNPYIFLCTGEKIFPKNLQDFYSRFEFLQTLLDNLHKNNVEPEYLDLRAPNDIVIKPRKLIPMIEGGKQNLASR